MPSSQFAWDRLLGLIAERKVIPIIGQDLLRVEVAGRSVLLYRYLAERLAQKLGVEMPSETAVNPLHETAARHLSAHGEWNEIYAQLRSLLPEILKLPLPEPLKKLAEIRRLRLFLTTTFDPLLQRALDEVRYQGDPVTEVLSFAPTGTGDIDVPLPESGTTVFHLLGRISYSADDYAVHEDDVVEFMVALHSTERRPAKLFRELVLRDLLIIGSGFDDWLTRFFIRSVRQKRLWLGSTPTGFVADDRTRGDTELLHYLQQSACVKVFDEGGPIEFVDQLHERWQAWEHEAAAEQAAAGPRRSDLEIVDGGVFISYVTKDRPYAEKIAAALRALKIDVWYDQTELRSGDAFGPKIRTAIERAAAFVPIISQDAVATGKHYFWSEWTYGIEQSKFYGPADAYFLPVLVDGTRYDDPQVPEELRRLTWERMTPNGPPEEWVDRVRQVVRKNRKQHALT
jgi:hypothetical protein